MTRFELNSYILVYSSIKASAMESYPRINYLEPLANYRLFVIFDTGDIKVYSLAERLQSEPFKVLQDEQLFSPHS